MVIGLQLPPLILILDCPRKNLLHTSAIKPLFDVMPSTGGTRDPIGAPLSFALNNCRHKSVLSGAGRVWGNSPQMHAGTTGVADSIPYHVSFGVCLTLSIKRAKEDRWVEMLNSISILKTCWSQHESLSCPSPRLDAIECPDRVNPG